MSDATILMRAILRFRKNFIQEIFNRRKHSKNWIHLRIKK